MIHARSFHSLWPYLAASVLGLLLGTFAVPTLAAFAGEQASTPLLRVAVALREDPHAPNSAWPGLSADLEAVRSTLVSPEREVFDLIVSVRGLESAGNSDWSRAEQLCRWLSWPRCDRATLAVLKESRP